MRIGIDTGGTFTDCVYTNADGLQVLKIPSTPADPGEAILRAVSEIAAGSAAEVRHGTTVGTNALLERKGARVAFITTAGFEDTIAIGRQTRAKLYDWFCKKEPPLAPEDLRFGVEERTASDGSMLSQVSDSELARLKEGVRAAAPESIAISLLFSFANPANELAVARALRELNVPVSVSHEILPEFREYERASTVLVNAYLAPAMQRYLERLNCALQAGGSRFHVMQSSGGIIPAAIAAREPVRTILSGPAGGVVGAVAVARAAGYSKILTFDMGGTSTDVALINRDQGLQTTKELKISGMPVGVPTLNIHTVGAGGGSLAGFDRGGALKVGPQSAGADPGPICYGRGDEPTVTDANLLLGRLEAGGFLAGGMPLNAERARERFLTRKGALENVESFAEGIIRVANAHMEKALRQISVEQGHDPREFLLVSFGGAGPLHACALAKSLRIPKVMIPKFPGALSAYGILVADFVRDYSRTVMLNPQDPRVAQHFPELERLGRQEMKAEGLAGTGHRAVDVRYRGQGFELSVPWSDSFLEQFHSLHEQRYGYSDTARPVEVVNVRVRMVVEADPVMANSAKKKGVGSNHAIVGQRPIYCESSWKSGTIYDRSRLGVGDSLRGPAVIVEYSATTYLPPDTYAQVDNQNNLLVEMSA